MDDSIFLLGVGDALVEMTAAAYDSEARLQGWLAQWPNLLAGAQVDPEAPRRWLFVGREVGVPNEENGSAQWSLDHLFLDQDGIPTFVEVKRSSDTRLRREVVGQMLDYAANAVAYWPPDRIRELFDTRAREAGLDPEQVLTDTLGDQVDSAVYWAAVRTNLQARKVRLLFVADEIPSELRRIVEFLNEQMDPAEVLALEIKQYVGADKQTLVPRVFGHCARRRTVGLRSDRIWDEASVFAALAARCPEPVVNAARRLFVWMNDTIPPVTFGNGKQIGSFGAGLSATKLLNVYTSGQFEVCFAFLKAYPPFDQVEQRRELLSRLREADPTLPDDAIDRRPSILLQVLADEAAMRSLLAAVTWAVTEMRTAAQGA